MAVAFVLISTAPTKEHEVYQKLLSVKEVTELYPLFGDYDYIAKVETKEYDDIMPILIEKIRPIVGIVDTKTLSTSSF